MVQHTLIISDNHNDTITVYTKEPAFVTVASRADLSTLKNLSEAQRAGIYILIGEEKRYIGQASTSIYNRLYHHHNQKHWWNQVMFFGREDGHLDKSQLDYLEALLIKEYREAGFQLENSTAGNQSWIGKISKIHADNIWHITQNILEEIANIDIFEKPQTEENLSSNTTNTTYKIVIQRNQVVSGKNPTQCYVNFFKYLIEKAETSEKVLELVQNGEPNGRFLLGTIERFDKSGMRLTTALPKNIYLYNNFSTADKKRVLYRFAETIELPIEIEWN